jgi:hypothetical protein
MVRDANNNIIVSVKRLCLCPPCIAKCDNPELLFTSGSATTPRVEGFDGMVPTLEGHTVSFSCPPGFVLTGSDSATCAGNGEWEPGPRGIMCMCNY